MDLDETIYDTHSLRIGRATDLFKTGCSGGQNQRNGQMEIKCSLQDIFDIRT